MKKKLTMLVAGLLPAMMIMAQDPVVVNGDVHVGASAELFSMGSVGLRSVYSDSDSAKAMIVNKGTLKLNGGISFHSTDDYTGVLLNEYAEGGTVDLSGVDPASVSVKKTFKKGSWYYMSFPFEVKLSSLKVEGGDFNPGYFRVYYYDVKKRANGSTSAGGSENWVQITDFTKSLTANQGYIMAVSSSYDGVEIEFPAASGLSELYSTDNNGDKSQTLSYDTGTSSREDWGWNFIGNPHSSNFEISRATTGYGGAIHYWNNDASNFIAVPMGFVSVVVRPFTPVFVQSWEDGMVFNFKTTGMTQEAFTPGLRSAANDMGFIELKLQGEEKGYDIYSLILANEGTPQGRNASKMFSPEGEAPQLWASVDDKSYSVNQMSFDGFMEIPLVVQLGENSRATLSLNELRNAPYDQISLVDLMEGKVFDLLNGEVCSVSSQNREEDRYLLRVGAGSTGMEEKLAQGVDIRVKEGQLILSNLIEADLIRVYNTSGVLVADRLANVSEEIIPLPGSGIYIVQISGTNSLVKKVINP